MTLLVAFLILNVGVLLGMILAALFNMARDPTPPSAAMSNSTTSGASTVLVPLLEGHRRGSAGVSTTDPTRRT